MLKPTESSETATGGVLRKGVLRNFAKFTGKHLCQRPATLLKKRPWHRCFLVNFVKFVRTPFSQNTSGWLLLKVSFNIFSNISKSPLEWVGKGYNKDKITKVTYRFYFNINLFRWEICNIYYFQTNLIHVVNKKLQLVWYMIIALVNTFKISLTNISSELWSFT